MARLRNRFLFLAACHNQFSITQSAGEPQNPGIYTQQQSGGEIAQRFLGRRGAGNTPVLPENNL